MAEKVTVDISKDGAVKLDFDGFEGETCFVAADKLREAFARQGLTVDTTSIEKKPETELRKTETSQKVGA
jgi:hypothetical protein